jgi:hypothetical protein
MKCEVRTVTPEEAGRLLSSNTCNRSLKKSHVQYFEAQLQRDEMQLTHQGIAISKSGKLLDGQHRLTAIVNSGITVELLVATDLPDESFAVLDTGVTRSAADALSVEGVANYSLTAAAIRSCICYEKMSNSVWNGAVAKKLSTASAVLDRYRLEPSEWDWAGQVAKRNTLTRILVPASAAALAYLAVRAGYSKEYVESFMRRLCHGADLSSTSPILAYRNKLTSADRTYGYQARLADYIKLFNAEVTGQEYKIFKSQVWPPMPKLIDAAKAQQTTTAS